jgi:hypothetical protein
VSDQVKQVFQDFRFEGTSLAKRFGPQGSVRFALTGYRRLAVIFVTLLLPDSGMGAREARMWKSVGMNCSRVIGQCIPILQRSSIARWRSSAAA